VKYLIAKIATSWGEEADDGREELIDDTEEDGDEVDEEMVEEDIVSAGIVG